MPELRRPSITSSLTRAALTGPAIALALMLATPAAAQPSDSPYDTNLPQFAHLAALEDRATALQMGGARDAAGRAQIIAAWQALQDAAAQTRLPDGTPHPLAYITKLKIASQLYADGQIDAALAMAETGLAQSRPFIGSYPATVADGAAQIGLLLSQKGDPERALALVEDTYAQFTRSAAATPDDSGFAMARSNLEFTLSQMAQRMGQTQRAIDFQKASLDTREAAFGPNHPDTIASYYSYAQSLRRADRMVEAEAFARTAVERASAHVEPSDPTYARALEMLGIILSGSGRPIEATAFLSRALELKREHEGADTLIFGYGIHNLGSILHQREQYEDAQPLLTEAEALMARFQGPGSAFPINALAYNGQAALALGDPAGAVRLLDEGRSRLGEDSRDLDALGRIMPDLVRAHMLTGRSDDALTFARQWRERIVASDTADAFELAFSALLETAAQAHEPGGGADPQIPQARQLLAVIRRSAALNDSTALPPRSLAAIDLVMEIAARHDDPALMLSAMTLISGSQLARSTRQWAAQAQAENPDLAAGLRDQRAARQRLDVADRAVLLALAQGGATLAEQQELAAARQAASDIEQSLQQRFGAAIAARAETETSVSAWQQSLAPGEALLAIAPVYYGTYGLLITPDSAQAINLGAQRKGVVDLAKALGASVRVGSFDETSSRTLGKALFSSELIGRLGRTQALRIHTGGPLASLPFSLLQGWDETNEGRWLQDRFAISYLSDLASPPTPASQHDRQGRMFDLVAFAAPTPLAGANAALQPASQHPARITDYFDRNAPDQRALASLPPLPGTAVEVQTVAAAVPWRSTTTFLGDAASEAAVSQPQTGRADIIIFATHGIVAGEVEGIAEPALVLSPGTGAEGDGVLTASEIARLDLRADWVILSSCDSAAGMGGGLPAFSGLAWAFRQAGARDLLVSHWKVRDDIAAYVSATTVVNYRKGLSKADALKQAIASLRQDSGIAGADHPFAWAPFVLIEG